MGKKKKYTPEEEIEVYKDIIENGTPAKSLIDSMRINIKCKSENQKKLINSIKTKDITICSGLAGTGKAQPLDAKILTNKGWVLMGDIKVNDEVATKDGSFTKVLAVYPQGEKDIYRIKFSDGAETECCLEHLWECSNEKERNSYKTKRENGKRVIVGKNTKTSVRTTQELINEIIVRDNRLNFSVPLVNEIKFDKKNNFIPPYLLGFLLGDGCFIGSSVRFSTMDNEIIDLIEKFTEKNGLKINKEQKTPDYRIVGQKNLLKYKLLELGLWDKKSDTKFIPNDYLFDSIENRKELLKGLMDSDGYCAKNGNIYFYTTSSQLKEDFLFLIRSLGFLANVTTKEPFYRDKFKNKIYGKTCYCICLNSNDFNPFKLKRKSNVFKPKTRDFPTRYIQSIDFIGKKEAQCILVENESHLYVTDDFILTHNTYLACAEALNLLKNDPKIKKIVIVKSVTTLKEEEMGFLKGSLAEKMEPVMYSFSGNFEKIIGKEKFVAMKNEGLIEEKPIAYVRGITIDNAIVIIDECFTGDSLIATDYSEYKKGKNTKKSTIKSIVNNFKKGKEQFVLSYNESTKTVEKKKVVHVFENGIKDIYNLYIDGKKNPLKTTNNHPFAVLENGEIKYKELNKINVGDYLLRLVNKDSQNSRILSKDNYDILLGLILGDGCIQKSKQNKSSYRLAVTHGLKQKEYSDYCKSIFNGNERKGLKSGYNLKPLCGFQTKNMHLDDIFINSCYNDDFKKSLSKNISDYFTERTLAFWYMDDGSLNKTCANFYTCSFTEQENNILIEILKHKFNIKAKLLFDGKYNYLQLDNNSTNILFNLIKPYVTNDLLYKIGNTQREFIAIKSNFIDDFSVSQVKKIEKSVAETVFNIEVEHNNNYLVDNYLVHNCQNITVDNMRTLLTRIGEDSKYILLGDERQIDMKDKKKSSLKIVMDKFEKFPEFGIVRLGKEDVVRHKLINLIEDVFAEIEVEQEKLNQPIVSSKNGQEKKILL